MHQLYLELKLILVLVGLRADRSLASGRGAQGVGGHDGVAEGSGVGGGGGAKVRMKLPSGSSLMP